MVAFHFADDTLASRLALALQEINDVVEVSLKELTDKEVDYFFADVVKARGAFACLISMVVAADAHVFEITGVEHVSNPARSC